MREDIRKIVLIVLEVILAPFVFISAIILKIFRKLGPRRLPKNTKLLKIIGIYPLRDHYYEPQFKYDTFDEDASKNRVLCGLDLRPDHQIRLLNEMNYQDDFENFLSDQNKKESDLAFNFDNGMINTGDAEFLYNYIRHLKPSKVIEIGCGSSTKIISSALRTNNKNSEHICIEPYEQKWLEKMSDIKVYRTPLEKVKSDVFDILEENDLLFIDSSHIIRPQGDVLKEYLEIIPALSKGVHIHVHDIFTPNDYPKSWLDEHMLFWNEQYILEALLTNTNTYEIVAALNFLKNNYYSEFKKVCPYITPDREPGSFYFKKVN